MLQHLLSSFLVPTEIWGTGIFGHAGVTEAQASSGSPTSSAVSSAASSSSSTSSSNNNSATSNLSSSTDTAGQAHVEWADQVRVFICFFVFVSLFWCEESLLSLCHLSFLFCFFIRQVYVEIPPDNSGNVSKILIVVRSHNEQRAKSLFSRTAEIVEV
jgi:hypothetical protein